MKPKSHIAQQMTSLLRSLPESYQQKIKTQNYIQRSYEQFGQVVEQGILNHVNSVYLLSDEDKQNLQDPESSEIAKKQQLKKKIVVYVDNSICAAELNARRELIVLKYRELFGLLISSFEIRISKGRYKKEYPYREIEEEYVEEEYELTQQDYLEISELVSKLDQPKLKDSFEKLLIAQKRKFGNKSKK